MFYAIMKETEDYEAEIHEFFTVKDAIDYTKEAENKEHKWIIVEDYEPRD